MNSYFWIILSRIAVMLVFIAIGFFLRKINIFRPGYSEAVSSVLAWVFLPLYTFRMLSRNFTVTIIESKLTYFVSGILVLAVIFLAALILSRLYARAKGEEGIYVYAFSAPNISYMGLAVIETIVGAGALYNATIFTLGLTVFIGSVGIYLITPRNKASFAAIFNPLIIATIAGMVFGLCHIPVPAIIDKVTDAASVSIMPCAMLVAGMVLAEKTFLKIFLNHKAYTASVIRLVVIPLFVFVILKFAGMNKDVIFVAVTIMAMPVDFNVIIFPRAYGSDATAGTQLAVISNILSIITIPLIIGML